ncbi:hypothetical protein C1H46_007114 [Malus baccata]|uniref:Uncharacterized protein n=1 Tax=Malus baccata TaxID=106549 RepID=A0A540N8B0_MALBA|nr:hypothetical protein C1H46_007114 [Malus baccata]
MATIARVSRRALTSVYWNEPEPKPIELAAAAFPLTAHVVPSIAEAPVLHHATPFKPTEEPSSANLPCPS